MMRQGFLLARRLVSVHISISEYYAGRPGCVWEASRWWARVRVIPNC